MSLFDTERRTTSKRSTVRLRPRVKGLEGRVVLSTFQVNTTLAAVPAIVKTNQDTSGSINENMKLVTAPTILRASEGTFSSISPRSAIMAADANGSGPGGVGVPDTEEVTFEYSGLQVRYTQQSADGQAQ